MKLVLFGLTISSSWGNGHATIWRGLIRALISRGWRVVFFERDTPYYAQTRDLFEIPGGRLVLYGEWSDAAEMGRRELADADVGMVTSFCPDGVAAADLVLDSPARVKAFYDLDTPVTLRSRKNGAPPFYIGRNGFRDFDLTLSYTGGKALEELRTLMGARRVAPLYGGVDPDAHRAAPPKPAYHGDLSYLGTYAEDRQPALERLLVEPAALAPDRRFVIGGAQYPPGFPWRPNIYFVRHLPPAEHPSFYCSSRLTLNVTRGVMAEMGHCPSGRLFEAAACGVPILSDAWEGLENFFEPGREILIARGPGDTISALERSDADLRAIARAARERVLEEHTSARRAARLETLLDDALSTEAAAAG